MPILDPISFCSLLNEAEGIKSKFSKHFFLRYLKIASLNLYRNLQTLDISLQFKKDLQASLNALNSIFYCNFTHNGVLDDPTISDYYRFLYNNIHPKFKDKILKKQKGDYFVLYNNIKMYFFRPYIDLSDGRSWFLTTSPYAALVITQKKCMEPYFIELSNLEADLLAASGFTIVLCVSVSLHGNLFQDILNKMISTHKFAEIHFNIDIQENDKKYLIDDFYSLLLNIYDNIDGYFYLYSQHVLDKESQANKIIKELKQKPRFRYIFTSNSINESLKKFTSSKTKPFSYCKTGFDDDKLCVSLCNVPFYNTEDDKEDYFATEFSGKGNGYIFKEDFLNYRNSRVKIIVGDIKNNNRHIERYIDFNDVHSIKSDMYVNGTIFLAKINENTLNQIDDIRTKIDTLPKSAKNVLKKRNKDFLKVLIYVVHEFEKYRMKFIENFRMHDNQLLAIFEACQSCFFSNKVTNKGVIYQVETGEGKSYIVQIIASVLALMKKTVHIISSNIILSNRDYYDSYDFFQKLGLTSAVFLHYNELPYKHNSINEYQLFNRNKFPTKYFSENLFNNSLNMNFSVCGIDADNRFTNNKANIIFSTIVNFECLYLKMTEMCPGYISKFFGNCSLIIDEADLMLIDELPFGTILSRPLKTNANEILKYVYKSKSDNLSPTAVYEEIRKNWPENCELEIDDVKSMYHDIETVNTKEFKLNGKYIIYEKEKNISLANRFKLKVDECKKNVIQFFKKKKEHKKHHKKKEKHHKESKSKTKIPTEKVIIPFDNKHKGIAEPNKEFGGFIQQFIAIKEMKCDEDSNNINDDIVIKDVSMNYLFVSHPCFIKLYDKVAGFTGTIGNKFDKEIYENQYALTMMKIPRNNPNNRIDLPIILCNDKYERYDKIVSEILYFHHKKCPVLAIFQEIDDIYVILDILHNYKIHNINIFDGKDVKMKPDIVAGVTGAITLGTNVCGRGTNIKKQVMPLHVIMTYFTPNSRVIFQAFGRTARQGMEGTARIICLKKQYIQSINSLNQGDLDIFIDDSMFRTKLQNDFIEKYKAKRNWIFSGEIEKQKLSNSDIITLRESKINANRIKVCNFIFPICMSVKYFLNIQAQRIFSLFNCPNSKYTWMLFAKYVREMILESWSICIDKSEREFNLKKPNIAYKQFLKNKVNELYDELDFYLPDVKNGIIDTFMHIYKIVLDKYQDEIMSIFPKKLTQLLKQSSTGRFCTFLVGFKPFSLIDNSGAKINTVDGTDQNQNYIIDPELKYKRMEPKGRFSILSITEKIDDIFNKICEKINEIIGCYTGLKFFMRRTLGGCEFGICIDYDISIIEEKATYDCLIDRDPMLLFTISLKSVTPFLAGILIFGLVYLASVGKSISDWIVNCPIKGLKIVKKVLVEIISLILHAQIESFCNSICTFIKKKTMYSIEKMKLYNEYMADIFMLLLKVLTSKDFSFTGDKLKNLFDSKVNLNVKTKFADKFLKGNIPWASLVKIGFHLIIMFAAFMFCFHHDKEALKNEKEAKVAEEYNEQNDIDKALKKNKIYAKDIDQYDTKFVDFEFEKPS